MKAIGQKKRFPRAQGCPKPSWVEAALQENPRQRFWQFYFRSPETKTGIVVRALLPQQLVPALEEYIDSYRMVLLGERPDPE